MDMFSMTDKGIEKEIGNRIRSLRLRKNLTQKQVSELVLLSLNSIKALEAGKGKLSTIIAVLRVLGKLDELNNFIPGVTISPLQIAKQQGKKRRRASGSRITNNTKIDSKW